MQYCLADMSNALLYYRLQRANSAIMLIKLFASNISSLPLIRLVKELLRALIRREVLRLSDPSDYYPDVTRNFLDLPVVMS